ncbi:MAG: ribonuclease H-like domain-containing protein [Candidatus Kuenenbacteria bacterium]
MNKLVIDIETVGKNLDDFDKISNDYFSHWAENSASGEKGIDSELKKIEDGFSFSPLTAEVVCIGILNPDTNKGKIYYQDPKNPANKFEDNGIDFKAMLEKEMLEAFWQDVNHYQEFITFNGRGFDIPFLMIRSAVHKIRPTKNLLSHRYLSSQFQEAKHIDLLDQLQFYGATWGKRGYNLHMFCQAFGIESPKGEGVSGGHVKEMFEQKRYEDIARYNVDDLYATAKLYEYWQKYINI